MTQTLCWTTTGLSFFFSFFTRSNKCHSVTLDHDHDNHNLAHNNADDHNDDDQSDQSHDNFRKKWQVYLSHPLKSDEMETIKKKADSLVKLEEVSLSLL